MDLQFFRFPQPSKSISFELFRNHFLIKSLASYNVVSLHLQNTFCWWLALASDGFQFGQPKIGDGTDSILKAVRNDANNLNYYCGLNTSIISTVDFFDSKSPHNVPEVSMGDRNSLKMGLAQFSKDLESAEDQIEDVIGMTPGYSMTLDSVFFYARFSIFARDKVWLQILSRRLCFE